MIVLYDVTQERQRGQQLTVLNRVLRHNLRNETNVISGFAEVLQGRVDDPTEADQARKIVAASDRLNSIASKVRRFEDVQGRVYQPESVTLDDLLTDVVGPFADRHDEATITWTVEPPGLRLRTDPVILSVLLEHLVENAVVHADGPAPTVRITGRNDGSAVCIEVRDENDRIPTDEIETLRAGEETPLQHGQGIGLWISYWCVRKLHGDIDFAYDDGNVVTVTL